MNSAAPVGGGYAPTNTGAMRGLAWSGASKALQLVFTLIVTAILARLLGPESFGLVAMAALLVNFFSLFRGQGIQSALVQANTASHRQWSSAFWYLLLAGTGFGLVSAALSPAAAWAFSEPALVSIISISALAIPMRAIGGAPSAILQRRGAFRAMAMGELLGQLVGGTLAIGAAFAGFGAFSLVIQNVATASSSTVFIWVAARWTPELRFDPQALQGLVSFGSNVTAFQIINFANRNLARLVISLVLGATSLGFFAVGQRIIDMIRNVVSGTTMRVMMPTMARLDSTARAADTFMKGNRLIAATLYFPLAAMAALGEDIVSILFGPAWAASVPVFRVFAVAAMVQVTSATTGWVFYGRGEPNRALRMALIVQPVTLVAVIIGLQWGITGVAWGIATTAVLLAPVVWISACKVLETRLRKLISSLAGIFLSASFAGAGMVAARLLLQDLAPWHPYVSFIAAGSIGILLYLAAIAWTDPLVVREVKVAVQGLMSRQRASMPDDLRAP